MRKKKQFQLALAKLPKGSFLLGLNFDVYEEKEIHDPVISTVEEMNYGELFAYLFRRFGYPAYGWDSYKDLVKYILTTPLDDMWLRVIPYPGSNDITFSFLVTQDVTASIRDWEQADMDEWERDRIGWYIEKYGRPEWADELCNQIGEEFGSKTALTFEQAAPYLEMMYQPDSEPKTQWDVIANEFFGALKPFEQEHERPRQRTRAKKIEDWREDDPLKSYAQAAVIALSDLKRPVRVRDWAISAFGMAEDGVDALKEPAVAGYAAGGLLNFNQDPEGAIAANTLIEVNGGFDWLTKITQGVNP